MIGSVLGFVVGIAGLVIMGRFALGLVMMALHRSEPPVGDEEIAAALGRAADRHTRRVAAAVVDLSGTRTVRVATIGCSVDHVFEIGSLSKAVTGMLLADAAGRGELRLTDRVDQHLPQLAGAPIGRATIGSLGEHRTGLPRMAFGIRMAPAMIGHIVLGLNPYAGQGFPFVIRSARRARLRGVGRTRYSNLGAALAGAVLAGAAGASYEELVQARLVTPLGLAHTSARADASRCGGFTRWGGWMQQWRMSGYAPAGGITSSVADLALVAEALLQASAPGSDSLHHGNCFWMQERTAQGGRVTWHNGQTGGYVAFLGLRPQIGRAIIVLADVADMRLIRRVADRLAVQD